MSAQTSLGEKKIRLGSRVRSALYRDIQKAVDGVQAVVVTKCDKVPTRALNELRYSLRGIDSNFLVVKNSLTKIVFRENGWTDLDKAFEGTCGIAPVRGDMASACKLLVTFQKDHEGFLVQAGVLQGKYLRKQDLDVLAKLPSRQVLLSQLAGVLQSPVRNLAIVLQAPIRQLALILAAVKQKREKEGQKA